MTTPSEALGEKLRDIDVKQLTDAKTGVFSPSLVLARIILGSARAATDFMEKVWDKINPELPSSSPESVLEKEAFQRYNEQQYGA